MKPGLFRDDLKVWRRDRERGQMEGIMRYSERQSNDNRKVVGRERDEDES